MSSSSSSGILSSSDMSEKSSSRDPAKLRGSPLLPSSGNPAQDLKYLRYSSLPTLIHLSLSFLPTLADRHCLGGLALYNSRLTSSCFERIELLVGILLFGLSSTGSTSMSDSESKANALLKETVLAFLVKGLITGLSSFSESDEELNRFLTRLALALFALVSDDEDDFLRLRF